MAGRTTTAKRAGAVALVGASVGVGSVAGPAVAAALVGYGLAVPVAAAGVVVALAAIVTYFGVHEGRPQAMASSGTASSIPGLAPYLLLSFTMVLGFGALQPTMPFFVQDRFRLETAIAIRDVSFASTFFAASSFVLQAFVIRMLTLRPRTILKIGLATCLLAVVGGVDRRRFGRHRPLRRVDPLAAAARRRHGARPPCPSAEIRR